MGYALTQGLHVTIGLITIPVLLAKLWSVIPRLFAWPAVRSAAQALERGVAAPARRRRAVRVRDGVLNIQNFYPWHFGFVRAHYYGAWVFIAAFTLHVAVKLPVVVRAYRERGLAAAAARRPGSVRGPEPPEPDGLAPVAPARPTLSRRGLLGLVGGASLTLLLAQRRRDGRRSAAAAGAARPARARVRHGPERFPGQPDGGGGRGSRRADRTLVAAVGRRAGRVGRR